MNIKHLFLFVAVAAAMTVSCGEKEEPIAPEINLVTANIPTISDEGGSFTVSFSSSLDWTATKDANWLSVNPASGVAGETCTVTVTAQPNTGYDPRSGKVTIICGDEKKASQTITVEQKQKGALVLTQTSYVIDCEGETITVQVKANSNVTAAVDGQAQNWIVSLGTKGLVDSEFLFEIKPNETYDERSGFITFSNEAGSERVTITQKQKGAIIITEKAFSVGHEGGSVSVKVKANVDVSYSIAEDAAQWINSIRSKGLTENDYTFEVLANETYMERSGIITFTSEAGSEEVTITQEAAPEPIVNEGVKIFNAAGLVQFAQAYNNLEYDQQEDLDVALAADIVFDATTSEAFNATGGIGLKIVAGDEQDYYFNGVFDGAGFTISGLSATVPLFKAIGESGTVKNLTIDNSCSFTFTQGNTGEAQFGAIVGYHKGVLDNVKVAADIALADAADVTELTQLGGLAGRATIGVIQNGCEYSGLISTPEGFTTTGKLLIGGLVGRFSNAGSVSDSNFKGAISNAAQVSSTESSNPYLIIGGIVGYGDGGATISSCNATADHAAQATAHSSMTGTIVNKTIVAYNSAVGGIVGELVNGTVSDCTNAANIALTIFKSGGAGSTGNSNARYMKTGGIVGKVDADGTVTNCTNNGKVEHRSNPRLQDLAGIAGYNAGTISGCTNNAAVNHMTTAISGATNKGGRIVNIAGVIGENVTGATVTDVHNTANLQISAMENNYDTDNNKPLCEARMGGVIAYNTAAIDGGASKSITNSGQVYFNCNFTYQFLGYELGGIVGYSTASVQNAKNFGYVLFNWNSDANVASKVYVGGIVGMMAGNGTIGGCINEGGESNAGEVNLNVKAGVAEHTDIYASGILGYSASGVSLVDCTNSGYVHGGNSTAHNNKTCFTGGIVAYLAGASSINNCDNSGLVYNNQRNNTDDNIGSTYNGGIAGYVLGTADNRISVENCDNTATGMFSRRGWVGGVVGYAEFADLKTCTFNKDVTLDCLCRGIGGIVGWGANTTITSCNFSGSELSATQIQTNRAGGIAGKLDNGTVDGCSSSVTTMINHLNDTSGDQPVEGGAIVGISGEGNTIKNCHYKATINGVDAKVAGTGEFTGEGNVADL